MADPRITKLAQVLVQYSLQLGPGDEFLLDTSPLAAELNLAVYKEALLSGAHVMTSCSIPGTSEIFFKYANDEQIDYVSPIRWLVAERFSAVLYIDAEHNTRELSGVDPARQSRAQKARAELSKLFYGRAARKELRWCLTVFPTHASAQEADMSLSEYEDFVYGAGMLDREDPVAAWQEEAERQRRLIAWLAGKKEVVIRGDNVDISMSIEGRKFIESAGRVNFPSGEIFTSPVRDSVNGWVRFSYPAIYGGREVQDIELWFEDGRAVKERASKGQDLLSALLDTDERSRYLGELGIGTNYNIQRFVKNMLFDEKIGGTIHLALGAGFPEAGGDTDSGLHWDMLCNMAQGEILVDGELFYQNGQFVV
ncbi:MAG: aminopeptidase [Anaerolineae bacterium]|nr:aminopeptidase [Anaerolineae bacterium]